VDDAREADELGLDFDITQSYYRLNYTIRAGQCFQLDEDVCDKSFHDLCNWFDDGGYCAYNNDRLLSSTFQKEGSLWWTCFPFVIFFAQLVWSLYFLRKYQVRPEYSVDKIALGKAKKKDNVKQIEMVKLDN